MIKMKIVIPNFSPVDSFVDNVTFTLKRMGHDVTNMGILQNKMINSPYFRLASEVVRRINPSKLSFQENWLLRLVKEKKTDVVLMLTQTLSEEVLFEVRRKGIKVVAWWGDTSANMKGKGLLIDEIDLIYIKDRYASSKLNCLGKNAFHLHEAMNPFWHKPISSQQNERIVIAGSFYDYRHYLTRKLLKSGIALELYGGKLPRWGDKEIRAHHTGLFVVREAKSKVFGSGLAVLNSTAMSEFNSLNCRAFEIAGAGGLQILEYREAVEECFEIGKEILVFYSYEELIEIITIAEKEKDKMRRIREAGAKRALAEHTYEHRLNRIINDVQQL